MKKLMMIMLLGAFAYAGQAQQFKMLTVEERVADATKELSLSEDQQTEWTKIYEAYDVKMKEAMQNRDRETMMQNRENMNAELKATLTDEQKEQFDEWSSKQRRRRP